MTVRGGGQGHDRDRGGAGAGIVGMVCCVHGIGVDVKWVSGGMQRRGLIRSLLCPGPWAICGRTPYDRIGGKRIKRNRMS